VLPERFLIKTLSTGNSLLQKCRERLYIRPKVVGPFPGPCASGSYVHRAASQKSPSQEICSNFLGQFTSRLARKLVSPSCAFIDLLLLLVSLGVATMPDVHRFDLKPRVSIFMQFSNCCKQPLQFRGVTVI
jgi:hypothetical protein